MDDENRTPRRAPQAWLDALAEGDADIDAGRIVPMEDVLAELEAALARMTAKSMRQA
jgi:predicted transcriptional regulator